MNGAVLYDVVQGCMVLGGQPQYARLLRREAGSLRPPTLRLAQDALAMVRHDVGAAGWETNGEGKGRLPRETPRTSPGAEDRGGRADNPVKQQARRRGQGRGTDGPAKHRACQQQEGLGVVLGVVAVQLGERTTQGS